MSPRFIADCRECRMPAVVIGSLVDCKRCGKLMPAIGITSMDILIHTEE